MLSVVIAISQVQVLTVSRIIIMGKGVEGNLNLVVLGPLPVAIRVRIDDGNTFKEVKNEN